MYIVAAPVSRNRKSPQMHAGAAETGRAGALVSASGGTGRTG